MRNATKRMTCMVKSLSRGGGSDVKDVMPTTLDGLFAKAAEYGQLRVCQSDDGTWHAHIKCPTSNPAIRAEANSGFNHPSPVVALVVLLEKLAKG